MPYIAPCIDASGLHLPTYTEIRDDLLAEARRIFGHDIYLEVDSQDYELISVLSLKIYDAFLACQAAYNSRGPATALGAGLDVVVGVNGIRRKAAAKSIARVEITGTPDTTITKGRISDVKSNKWALSESVTIPASGSILATVLCVQAGPISAAPHTLTSIDTPTRGWLGVTNPEAALAGAHVEIDPQLRGRQAISTAQPSRTVLEGTKGAIAAVPGVKRFEVYENDTSEYNALGHPPHSITSVVEDGLETDIAAAIYFKKTPGCYTNGPLRVEMLDQYDEIISIGFYRPSYIDLKVEVTLKQLPGYTSAVEDGIKKAVADYLNSLGFGDRMPLSALWAAAMSATDLKQSALSIQLIRVGVVEDDMKAEDVPLLFYEIMRGAAENVTVIKE